MLKELIEKLSGKTEENLVVKETKKMTEPQKKMWKEFLKLKEEHDVIMKTGRQLKDKFWNKVEGDLEMFNATLRVNDEDFTIEVLEQEECEDDDTVDSTL